MPDEPHSEEFGWLIQPPSAGQAHVYVNVPKGTNLPPKALEALETFAKELLKSDQGFAQGRVNCNLDNCQPVKVETCFTFISCRIQ